VKIPTLDEQQKIASILSNVDSLIQQYDKVIESTKQLKKSLMQQLLTKGIGHKKFKKVKWYFGKEFEIPEGWKMITLGKVCSKITDGVHKTPKYVKGGIPFLSVNNLETGKIDFLGCKFISKMDHDELSKRCHPQMDDLLMGKVGTLGVTDVVDFHREFNVFVQLALLRPIKSKILPLFLKLALLHSKNQNRIKSVAAGTTLKYIGIKSISELKIPLPSIDEQEKISLILSNVESQIFSLESKKTNLEIQKKGLMQKLLTGQVRVSV